MNSPFLLSEIAMYNERYGIHTGQERAWSTVAEEFGHSPNVAAEIGEAIHEWLDENSPYRNRKMMKDGDVHRYGVAS